MARIVYPTEFEKLSKLFDSIYAKHSADGDNSSLKDYDFDDLKTKNTNAYAAHVEADALTQAAQKKREERNVYFDAVDSIIHRIGNFLKAKYPDNPRKLSEWGFSIDDSPSSSSSKASANNGNTK
jgi:hypothetical protein